MAVTELGIIIDVSPEQPKNVPLSIVVTELGIVTEFRSKHPSKAQQPIAVTEFGIITDVNSEQSSNADLPMVMTVYNSPSKQMLCGITMEPVYLSPLLCVTSAVLASWFSR